MTWYQQKAWYFKPTSKNGIFLAIWKNKNVRVPNQYAFLDYMNSNISVL